MTAQTSKLTTEPRRRQSRVGKRPIELPKGVTATVDGGKIDVKGPKGQLSRAIRRTSTSRSRAASSRRCPTVGGRDGARFQGLARALIAGMVKGVADGYTKTLELVGTGYRAELKGTDAEPRARLLAPGRLPAARRASRRRSRPTRRARSSILTGADKEVIGQTAAKIRGFRPPEPYGGKGVRYQGEKVREKAGKAGKGGKKYSEEQAMAMQIVGRERRKLRIRRKISGTAERPRLSVFRSAKHIYAQVVDDVDGHDARARLDALAEVRSGIAEDDKSRRGQEGRRAHREDLLVEGRSTRSSSTATATSITGASALSPRPPARPASKF